MVTDPGSPPKCMIFSWIHRRAATWSKYPQLPRACSSPVLQGQNSFVQMLSAGKEAEGNTICGVSNHLPFSTQNLSTQLTDEWLGKPWDWSSSPTRTDLEAALRLEIVPNACRCSSEMFLCISKSSALLFTKALHTSFWKSLWKNRSTNLPKISSNT